MSTQTLTGRVHKLAKTDECLRRVCLSYYCQLPPGIKIVCPDPVLFSASLKNVNKTQILRHSNFKAISKGFVFPLPAYSSRTVFRHFRHLLAAHQCTERTCYFHLQLWKPQCHQKLRKPATRLHDGTNKNICYSANRVFGVTVAHYLAEKYQTAHGVRRVQRRVSVCCNTGVYRWCRWVNGWTNTRSSLIMLLTQSTGFVMAYKRAAFTGA